MASKTGTIGFIGAGNMGSAMLEGLLAQRVAAPSDLHVYDKDTARARNLKERHGVAADVSALDLVKTCRVIVLAVKPQDLEAAASEFRAALTSSHVVISILAGMTIEKLGKALGSAPQLVRAMPNLGAMVRESLTAVTSSSDEALAQAEIIFNACGKTVRLDEKFFDLVTALSGSGPAYFFLLMETLMAKGIERGLAPEVARTLAVQTAVGAAQAARNASDDPAELRRKVTSKGGTTEAALKVLSESGVPAFFSKAYDAAESRGRELRGG